ncbi:hypothetical protein [Pararobbsia alpina]|uniref:hypothetical protein n=1 Tax=Pararobbsia alpina TaxID=621374 RepID=UPI0039A49B87
MTKHAPIDKSVDSTRALWLLLKAAIEQPGKVSEKLVAACATQASICLFQDPHNKIVRLSLNTLKNAAEIAVEPGGWKELNSLRRKVAILRLANTHGRIRNGRGIREELKRKIKENLELVQRVQELLRGRTLLLSAYMDTVEMLRTHAKLSPVLHERLHEHESIFNVRTLSKVEDGNDDEK